MTPSFLQCFQGQKAEHAGKNVLINAEGQVILKVDKTIVTFAPNSITQMENKRGGIDRKREKGECRYIMNAKMIRDRLSECVTLMGFTYNGAYGNIDPCYSPENGYSYLMYFKDKEETYYNLDDVMAVPFFDGKSLSEICDQIEVDEW